jgi:hypothetical protein
LELRLIVLVRELGLLDGPMLARCWAVLTHLFSANRYLMRGR